jgi:hypothetical protein
MDSIWYRLTCYLTSLIEFRLLPSISLLTNVLWHKVHTLPLFPQKWGNEPLMGFVQVLFLTLVGR